MMMLVCEFGWIICLLVFSISRSTGKGLLLSVLLFLSIFLIDSIKEGNYNLTGIFRPKHITVSVIRFSFVKKKIRRRGIFQSTISARRNETENEKGFFPLHSSLIFKYVIRVDYRFGRQISPAAFITRKLQERW